MEGGAGEEEKGSGMKPVLAMMVVQVAFAGVNIVYKLAASDGMNLKVLVAYRLSLAATFMVPLALLLERKKRANLTRAVLFQAFLCGFFGGTLTQNLYLKSLALTSATFASAMANLVPAITFVIGVIFGLEKLHIRTGAGKAKVIGTSIGVAGAMLLTFYKGADVNIWSTHIDLLHKGRNPSLSPVESSKRLIGALLALGSGVSYAIWLVIQTKMSHKYPAPYSSTALMNVMAAVQSVSYAAACTHRNLNSWKLGWNIRLLAAAYAGIVGSGLMVSVMAWCVQRKGPLFVAVFNPLMLVLVAIAGSLMLNETLHVGSILGAVLIVCGLYVVLWGKGHEVKRVAQLPSPKPHTKSEISIEISKFEDLNSSPSTEHRDSIENEDDPQENRWANKQTNRLQVSY